MAVTLERVQFKFASIIGELCSEPDILSQFAVWIDLRLAEYKLNGSISLDCSGELPDAVWLKGIINFLVAGKIKSETVSSSDDLKISSNSSVRGSWHSLSQTSRRNRSNVQPDAQLISGEDSSSFDDVVVIKEELLDASDEPEVADQSSNQSSIHEHKSLDDLPGVRPVLLPVHDDIPLSKHPIPRLHMHPRGGQKKRMRVLLTDVFKSKHAKLLRPKAQTPTSLHRISSPKTTPVRAERNPSATTSTTTMDESTPSNQSLMSIIGNTLPDSPSDSMCSTNTGPSDNVAGMPVVTCTLQAQKHVPALHVQAQTDTSVPIGSANISSAVANQSNAPTTFLIHVPQELLNSGLSPIILADGQIGLAPSGAAMGTLPGNQTVMNPTSSQAGTVFITSGPIPSKTNPLTGPRNLVAAQPGQNSNAFQSINSVGQPSSAASGNPQSRLGTNYSHSLLGQSGVQTVASLVNSPQSAVVRSGAPLQVGGASLQMAGSSSPMGHASVHMGGASVQMGGGSVQMGGTSVQMGGGSVQMGRGSVQIIAGQSPLNSAMSVGESPPSLPRKKWIVYQRKDTNIANASTTEAHRPTNVKSVSDKAGKESTASNTDYDNPKSSINTKDPTGKQKDAVMNKYRPILPAAPTCAGGPAAVLETPLVPDQRDQEVSTKFRDFGVRRSMELFETWIQADPFFDFRHMETIKPEELDVYLAAFYTNVKASETSAIKRLKLNIDIFLMDNGYQNSNLMTVFHQSNVAFRSRLSENVRKQTRLETK